MGKHTHNTTQNRHMNVDAAFAMQLHLCVHVVIKYHIHCTISIVVSHLILSYTRLCYIQSSSSSCHNVMKNRKTNITMCTTLHYFKILVTSRLNLLCDPQLAENMKEKTHSQRHHQSWRISTLLEIRTHTRLKKRWRELCTYQPTDRPNTHTLALRCWMMLMILW